MQSKPNGNLERKSSEVSNSSRRSAPRRSTSRKQSLVTPMPDSAKSLVSFPSLSPDHSPGASGNKADPFNQLSPDRKSTMNSPTIVETLLRNSSSFRGRSALFEDSPRSSPKNVLGSLHLLSDAHLGSMISKNGAVNMVRQLAEDLAQRDADITALRHRVEEREKELKRMLREAEVSNLEIETRLHRIGGFSERQIAIKSQDDTSNLDARKDAVIHGSSGLTNGINEMMGEAMGTDVGTEIDEGYLDSLAEPDKYATIRVGGLGSRENDGRSTNSSIDSRSRPGSTIRGWKEYLWNGTASRKTSRASSFMSDQTKDGEAKPGFGALNGGTVRRRRLDSDLFLPPQRSVTTHSASSDTQSRKSSNSVTSWTMKLFAGNPQAEKTVRGRSATTSNDASQPSKALSGVPGPPLGSAKAALMKMNGGGVSSRTTRSAAAPSGSDPLRTVKSTSQPSNAQLPQSPKTSDASTNLGPVEMDTILPVDSKPPTLTQNYNNYQSSEYLTDRFGFIYDQARRKREATALSGLSTKGRPNLHVELINDSRDAMKSKETGGPSGTLDSGSSPRPNTPASTEENADEKPTKRWQDYLKVATFPTELLSHTPSSNPRTSVISTDTPTPLKRSPTFGDARGSLPSSSQVPPPLASPITAGNAEIAKPSAVASGDHSKSTASGGGEGVAAANTTATTTKAEPVKILLAQLTELHDSLQRDRTVKWNEFLRKIRAERKKEGESVGVDSRSKQAIMPEATLTDGEMIGVAGLGNKGKVGLAKWKEFKQLVLAGIPIAYRAKIWAECSGASALRVPGYYDDLVSNGVDDPEILAQIQMDINRTLTDNVFFRKGPGVTKLHEVLLAYSRRNPEVGYCQGMNLITASLLLIMPSAEDAFWMLTSMIETILPQHYYDHSLLTSRADQQVLRQYVAEILPKLSSHLDDLGIELEALTFQWFLSVFTDCLSAEALFRVWDVVLCFNDGSTFLFQVALALLKLNEAHLLECETAAGVYGYIGHEMTDHAISIDGLVRASEALKNVVRRNDVEERRRKAVEEERRRGVVMMGAGVGAGVGAAAAAAADGREELRKGEGKGDDDDTSSKKSSDKESNESEASENGSGSGSLSGSDTKPLLLQISDPIPVQEESEE